MLRGKTAEIGIALQNLSRLKSSLEFLEHVPGRRRGWGSQRRWGLRRVEKKPVTWSDTGVPQGTPRLNPDALLWCNLRMVGTWTKLLSLSSCLVMSLEYKSVIMQHTILLLIIMIIINFGSYLRHDLTLYWWSLNSQESSFITLLSSEILGRSLHNYLTFCREHTSTLILN